MRVVIAPDEFGGTLTAAEAAAAVAAGWSATWPSDELELVPVSDGGPGFCEVLSASLGGEWIALTVRDPLGRPTPARLLRVGATAYVESAQACGLQLVAPHERDPLRAASAGVGDLVAAAASGTERIVVGLGGSATSDGGAGMLEALGLALLTASGDRLPPGAGALASLDHLGHTALSRPPGDLLAATDVDNPLLGPDGASTVFGPQKGATGPQVAQLEEALANLCRVVGRDLPGTAGLEWRPGAGAAGGLGYGLFVLGARCCAGIELVLDEIAMDARLRAADLVVTGEGSLDRQSLRGKAVAGVARRARACGVRCVALAGTTSLASSELEAASVAAAYSIAEQAGSREAALADPADRLYDLARSVAVIEHR